MNDFDYKNYSLQNLEKWLSDSLTAAEATPQEIYDVIRKVVEEEYYYFKHHTGRCYDLLALLNGHGHINKYEERLNSLFDKDNKLTCDKDDKSPECQNAWNDFWEDSGSSKKSSQYTEEELSAMCDKAESDDNKKRWEVVGEDKPYPIRVSEDGDVWITDSVTKEDKVVKWQLPVEVDGISGEYYIQFPDDLMEAAGIEEDNLVEWIDRKDGSFELRKVNGSK